MTKSSIAVRRGLAVPSTDKAGQVRVTRTYVPLEHLEAYVAEIRARMEPK